MTESTSEAPATKKRTALVAVIASGIVLIVAAYLLFGPKQQPLPIDPCERAVKPGEADVAQLSLTPEERTYTTALLKSTHLQTCAMMPKAWQMNVDTFLALVFADMSKQAKADNRTGLSDQFLSLAATHWRKRPKNSTPPPGAQGLIPDSFDAPPR